jgi:hypothetical protein
VIDVYPDAKWYDTPFEFKGPGHSFVKIGDKYYDAEVPWGVSQMRKLPIFKKNGYKYIPVQRLH